MAYQAHNRTLPDWFTKIRTRQIMLPRFQRYEAWGFDKVTQVFNTLLQDLPIGAVLILQVGKEEPFLSRSIKGTLETGERVTEHLLDGQQRLTALWRGFLNNYDARTFFLFMSTDEETGMPYYVSSIARSWKQGDDKPGPKWANEPKKQWKKRRAIPLDLFNPEEGGAQRFREWAKIAIPNIEERDEIVDETADIRVKFAAYNIPYMSLPVETKKDTAVDVFIKMNTSAMPLSIYDIVVAQVEESMSASLHDLVSETRENTPSIEDYYSIENLTLNAGALMQGKVPTSGNLMSRDFGPQLLENWNRFLSGVARATAFLKDEHIYDAARLPSEVVVPVLVALWSVAPEGLDAEGRARSLLQKYIWNAFFSARYEKSTNSRSVADYNDLLPLVTGTGDSNPSIFDSAQYPLPQLEELRLARWPKKKDRLARAILAVALKNGGQDLADGSPVTRDNIAKREYHHLFAEAHLRELGYADTQIYRSLNCALVSWRTNRNISAKQPEVYLAERLEGTDVDESEIRERLLSHLIPYEELIQGNYDRFIDVRAEMIHEAMLQLCRR